MSTNREFVFDHGSTHTPRILDTPGSQGPSHCTATRPEKNSDKTLPAITV